MRRSIKKLKDITRIEAEAKPNIRNIEVDLIRKTNAKDQDREK